jgi:hypothetical protein
VRRPAFLAFVCVVALSVASCGGAPVASGPTTATTRRPLPAGPLPSEISRMVCQREAQHDIAQVLGVRASVGSRTWMDHTYSCRYGYPTGYFDLSVKELSSWPQTLAYYHQLGSQLGNVETLGNLGQGAFRTSDGSVVVRKDWKVLLVDTSHLANPFGIPPTSSADVAYTVADLILACWAGD